MKLADRDEFSIIRYLKSRSGSSERLIRGIGDDCAVTTIGPGEVQLVTTDLLTEGVHFKREWIGLNAIGRKAVTVNVSDLAAMGAEPRFLFLSLAIPDPLTIADIENLLDGFLSACSNYGVILAGGDTCRSTSGLTLSVTAYGVAAEAAWVGRDGAEVGDAVCLTGTVGDSALALQQLFSGLTPEEQLLQRHVDPTARVEVGRQLAAGNIPTAMIDISDGLLGDLGHLLSASGVGAHLKLDLLPLSQSFRSALTSNASLIDLALAGGEDYELLFTAPASALPMVDDIAAATGVPIGRIGNIVEGHSELKVYGPNGVIPLPAKRGYKHFPETG